MWNIELQWKFESILKWVTVRNRMESALECAVIKKYGQNASSWIWHYTE